jgi:thioredoxin 1
MSTETDRELEDIRRKKMEEMQAMAEGRSMEGTMPDTPVTVEDSTFDQLVGRYNLMVIDCWASWCGPCLMVAPIVDELARSYAGKVVFGKLNVDENPQTAGRFGIMSIPTLLIVKNGSEVDRIVGAVPKQVIESTVRKYID